MKSDTASSPRKGYFDFKRIVDSLNLPRAQHIVLSAILACCPNGKLSTREYPLIVDKIAYQSKYSRSRTYEALKDLEDAQILHRERRKIRNEYGTVRNLPTIYTINLPDAPPEAFTVEPHAPKKAPLASDLTFAPSPAPEPQEEPTLEPEETIDEYDFADVDPMDPPPGYYEAQCAEYYAQVESTIPTVDEPQNVSGDDLSSEPTPDPLVHDVAPQSPRDFTEEEQAMGHEIAEYAHAKLEPLLEDTKTCRRAANGRDAITAAMFIVGRVALAMMDQYAIGVNEVLQTVDEWIVKAVLRDSEGHLRQALRLCIFIENKGKHVDSARRRKLGLLS